METSPRFFNEKTHFQRLCLFSRCLYTPLSLSLYFSFSLIFLFAEASLEKKPNRFHGNDLALRYSINEPLFSDSRSWTREESNCPFTVYFDYRCTRVYKGARYIKAKFYRAEYFFNHTGNRFLRLTKRSQRLSSPRFEFSRCSRVATG